MSVERHSFQAITPWTGEHLHRYFEARKYIKPGDTVLDLACGTGYGSELLSQIAQTVVYGGDIDTDAIKQCKHDWKDKKVLRFEVMDATSLRFEDGFFNKIVSLETIEHLTAYKQMLQEFNRVLKRGGIAVISTPNIKISSPDGKIVNPFHTQEFTYDEFYDILKAEFDRVTIYGQRYSRYQMQPDRKIMRFAEQFLLMRGVRKLPYKLRNNVFEKVFKAQLYPTPDDYRLNAEKEVVENHCHVLFAVCEK